MTSFSAEEAALEAEMSELGVQRRRGQRARLRAAGRESLTPAGHHLTRAAMSRVVAGLTAWREEQEAQAGVRRAPAYACLDGMAAPQLALLAIRVTVDAAVRGVSWNAWVHRIAGAVDAERVASEVAAAHPGSWSALRRNAAACPERAKPRLRRAVRAFAAEKGVPRWSIAQRLKVGALLAYLVELHAGLVQVVEVRAGRRTKRIVRLAEGTEAWIAEADRRDEILEPLYLPMLDVPAEWSPRPADPELAKAWRPGGYATGLVARQYLVKNRSKAIREGVAGADMPAVYAAVNRLQATPWQVNPDVLEVARALWESGERWAGLAAQGDDPLPPKPPGIEADRAAFRDWMRRRFLIRRENVRRACSRGEAARILWLAGRLADAPRFHYPQQLDFRGRIYPTPQYLQPQGPDLARGLLRFADGAWLDRAAHGPALRWFWIHGANCLGLDKLALGARVNGIIARADEIRRVAADPLDCRWWQEADEPWQFLAWCLEAGELLDTGRVRTRIPCYVDGTNNGLQLLSLLLRDPVGGAATNCLPGERRDVYQDIADGVTARLREVDDATARGWLSWFPGGRMPRAAAKRPVMTLPYGCTPYSVKQYVAAWYEEEVRQGKAGPWGGKDEYRRCAELAEHLWAVIERELGRSLEAMRYLRGLSDQSVDKGICPAWRAPTGFPVRQPYPNWRTRVVSTRLGERVRWVRHRADAAGLNKRRHRNGLAPNFVHSLDAAVLASAVAAFDAGPISTIHDSFGTTAPYVERLGRCLRQTMADVFETNLLADLVNQLDALGGGRVSYPSPPAMGSLDPRAVLDSTYLFS